MNEPTVRLNDHPRPCPAGLTLAALLQREGLAPERVASALDSGLIVQA